MNEQSRTIFDRHVTRHATSVKPLPTRFHLRNQQHNNRSNKPILTRDSLVAQPGISVERQPLQARHALEVGLAVPQRLLPRVVIQRQLLPGQGRGEGRAGSLSQVALGQIDAAYALDVGDGAAEQLAAGVTDVAALQRQVLQRLAAGDADAEDGQAVRGYGYALELEGRQGRGVAHALGRAVDEPLEEEARYDHRGFADRAGFGLGVRVVEELAVLVLTAHAYGSGRKRLVFHVRAKIK